MYASDWGFDACKITLHVLSYFTFDWQSFHGGIHLNNTEPACVQSTERTDYKNLPQPVRYEELQREVMSEWTQSGCRRVVAIMHPECMIVFF